MCVFSTANLLKEFLLLEDRYGSVVQSHLAVSDVLLYLQNVSMIQIIIRDRQFYINPFNCIVAGSNSDSRFF